MTDNKSYRQLREISTAVLLEESSHLRIILRGVIGIALGGAVTRLFAAGILFMRWLKKSQDLKV